MSPIQSHSPPRLFDDSFFYRILSGSAWQLNSYLCGPSHPKLRTTFNMLIVNMAASDILDALTAVPLSVTYLFHGVKWFSAQSVSSFASSCLPCLSIHGVICPDIDSDDL